MLRPGRGDALPGAGVPEWGGALHAARAEVAALQRHLPRAVRHNDGDDTTMMIDHDDGRCCVWTALLLLPA